MAKKLSILSMACMLLFASVLLGAQDVSEKDKEYDPWPREFKSGDTLFTMYQPQIDSWDGFALKAHSAIGVESPAEAGRKTYGVADFTVDTVVDKAERTAQLENLRFTKVIFPTLPDKEKEYLEALKEGAPLHLRAMSLDRLEANLAIITQLKKGKSRALENSPPKILFSQVPSILVYIDGEAVFAAVKGTALKHVINTRFLMLKDTAGTFYLRVFDGYMKSDAISGPWSVSKNPPAELDKARKALSSVDQIDLLQGEADPETKVKPTLAGGQAPRVHVSFVPAELIVTDGEPDYLPIEGTNLLYVSNTTANGFRDLDDQKLYVLISGRWFSSASETGPWEYIEGSALPADFSNIPDESPKGDVKASVPGTRQAQEALISNNIPTTVKADRDTAKIDVQIDGIPDLRPVAGTNLYYVFNCPVPVIKADNRWYALSNGMWFISGAVRGPWVVADTIPAVIYSIPTYSPLHYVTYVRVYHFTPDHVYFGYTAGYYGTMVSEDGTVVFGSGYNYPAYAGPDIWYSPIKTYGYGCHLSWTPWFGWSYTFGFGWGTRYYWYYPPAPNWGPYYTWRRNLHGNFRPWNINTSGLVFRRLDKKQGNISAGSRPERYWHFYNSTTGNAVAGRTGAWGNAASGGAGTWNNNAAGGAAGWGGQTGAQGASGPAGSVQPPVSSRWAGGATGSQPPVTAAGPTQNNQWGTGQQQGIPAGTGQNNVYATKGGNVYRYEETAQGGGWRNANSGQAVEPKQRNGEYEELNRERRARHTGNLRTKYFRDFRRQGFQNEGAGAGGWQGGSFAGSKGGTGEARESGGSRGGAGGRWK